MKERPGAEEVGVKGGRERCSRRGFARGVAGVAAASLSLASRRAAAATAAPEAVRVASLEELADGAVVDFEYPAGHPAFLVRLEDSAEGGVGADGNIVAFHRACPHMGCPLSSVDVEQAQLGPCACHLSLFDLRKGGLQIYGMASQALVKVELEVRDGDVYATGIKGLPYGEALTEAHR